VEGYFDVIALYEIGVKNVVASMGTALSLSQLFRAANLTTTGEVIILFDQDAPGQRATERVSALIDGLQNPAILKKYQNLLKEIRHPVVTIKSASISESIQFLMNSESSLDISTGASSSPIVDTSTVLFDGDEPPLSDSIRPAPTTVAQTFHGHSMKKLSKIKDCADVVQSFEKDIAQRIIVTMIELSKPLKTIKF
jgi:5S rRNA maturation endonuclease (ribonuclease M5)